MTDHTPTPWAVKTEGTGITLIVDDQGLIIAQVTGYVRNSIESGKGEAKENARRIVACVNACVGIPTETLDKYYGDQGGIDAALEETSLRDHISAVQ
jgi:hypothetical protein